MDKNQYRETIKKYNQRNAPAPVPVKKSKPGFFDRPITLSFLFGLQLRVVVFGLLMLLFFGFTGTAAGYLAGADEAASGSVAWVIRGMVLISAIAVVVWFKKFRNASK